jgi:hypothetical protein
MATFGITHRFAGGTKDQYEASIARVHPQDGSLPEGQTYHAAGATDDGWVVIAIWDTRESWERFRDETLMPGLLPSATRDSPRLRRRRRSRSTTSRRASSSCGGQRGGLFEECTEAL